LVKITNYEAHHYEIFPNLLFLLMSHYYPQLSVFVLSTRSEHKKATLFMFSNNISSTYLHSSLWCRKLDYIVR